MKKLCQGICKKEKDECFFRTTLNGGIRKQCKECDYILEKKSKEILNKRKKEERELNKNIQIQKEKTEQRKKCSGCGFILHFCEFNTNSREKTHGLDKRCRPCIEIQRGDSFKCIHEKIKYDCTKCLPRIGCNNCKMEKMSRNKTYQPYCFKCYCILNPDIDIPRRYKVKETHLKEALTEFNFINDEKIKGGCSLRRPDFLLDLILFVLIIECDEHGHSGYNTTCEVAKLNDTFTDLADRHLVILRFNPDSYNKVSCFDQDCKLNKDEWNKRIKILKKSINKWIEKSKIGFIPDDIITIEYLFHNKK